MGGASSPRFGLGTNPVPAAGGAGRSFPGGLGGGMAGQPGGGGQSVVVGVGNDGTQQQLDQVALNDPGLVEVAIAGIFTIYQPPDSQKPPPEATGETPAAGGAPTVEPAAGAAPAAAGAPATTPTEAGAPPMAPEEKPSTLVNPVVPAVKTTPGTAEGTNSKSPAAKSPGVVPAKTPATPATPAKTAEPPAAGAKLPPATSPATKTVTESKTVIESKTVQESKTVK